MNLLLEILGGVLFVYTLFWTCYDFLLGVAALFFKSNAIGSQNTSKNFIIVIPAYREGPVLLETVEEALKVDYPSDRFQIVVLAQDLTEETLGQLSQFEIEIVITGGLGSKLNALKNWITDKAFQEDDTVFILDADNTIAPNALRVASALLAEHDVIQLERKKTEATTPLGILDRWNTYIGLALSNDSRMVLGLNTFILGSGFAVNGRLYQRFVLNAESTIAEDKALDLFLAKDNRSVVFSKRSYVQDSTIERSNAFSDQRARWVGGKIEARKNSRRMLRTDLTRIEYWDKAIHYTAPQRSILIPLVILGLVLNSFLESSRLLIPFTLLPVVLVCATILMVTPRSMYSVSLLKAFVALPFSVYSIVRARLLAKNTVTEDFKVTPK